MAWWDDAVGHNLAFIVIFAGRKVNHGEKLFPKAARDRSSLPGDFLEHIAFVISHAFCDLRASWFVDCGVKNLNEGIGRLNLKKRLSLHKSLVHTVVRHIPISAKCIQVGAGDLDLSVPQFDRRSQR